MLSLIWLERRASPASRSRRGPNRLGPFGLLQPVADAIKLMQKEALTPRLRDSVVFYARAAGDLHPGRADLRPCCRSGRQDDASRTSTSACCTSSPSAPPRPLMVFMAGWSSNNKYSLFGAMRVIAMAISYEIPMVLALLGVVLFAGTMNLNGIVHWQQDHHIWLIFLQPLAAFIYFISASAELNRTPTDIAEAESEIVGRLPHRILRA